ncbi:MAG TPA: ABC transporter substrate-binding protein [Fimbriimonadaceae bacterium]|nr:ABC transporter substrate-binding protein [Fimbriimonadaceae bacterium]
MRGTGLAITGVAMAACLFGLETVPLKHDKPGRIHIKYWEKWSGFEFDAIKKIVDDFNASQDKIFVDLLQTSEIENKAMFAISAGVPPDVAGLYSPNVPHYADERAIIPLDDFCRESGITQGDYIPAYWQLMTYKGKVFALPTTPASTALHYNRGLFREIGLDPNKPPETMEEMDAISDKMTVEKDGHIDRVGFTPSEPGWFNYAWGYYFGGRLWDGVSKITAMDPGNIDAYRWIESFGKRYGGSALTSFKSGLGQFDSPNNGFMDSKVGMEIQGVWMYNFVHTYGPQIDANAAPFPHPKDRPDLANTTYVDADVLCIPRGAAHPKEAWEFIRYVQRQEVMEKLCLLHKKNSPLTKISDHFWQVHANPWIHLFDSLARGKNAKVPARVGIWPEYQQELSASFDQALLLQGTPEQILQDVQDRMQAKLDGYSKRLKQREAEGL